LTVRKGGVVGGADNPRMIAPALPWLLLFDPAARRGQPAAQGETLRCAEPEPRLYCAHCGAFITWPAKRIHVQGRYEHTFTNPHGHVFHIGCFAAAPGCASVGAPTSDHTWFTGFRWVLALCASCDSHLGWEFTGGGERFYALITRQLSERGAARGG
jgi:hypothetical protein